MFTTYKKLLEDLARIRNARYSADPERDAALLEALYMTVFTMLEKLTDDEEFKLRHFTP